MTITFGPQYTADAAAKGMTPAHMHWVIEQARFAAAAPYKASTVFPDTVAFWPRHEFGEMPESVADYMAEILAEFKSKESRPTETFEPGGGHNRRSLSREQAFDVEIGL